MEHQLEPKGYRRLFIMRKDLKMSPGKLVAQVAHCAEAYWMKLLRNATACPGENDNESLCEVVVSKEILHNYVDASFVKTICEAKNKNKLLKAKEIAEEIGLIEGEDFGLIYDNCLTELTPEEENGTTLTGIWFRPLPDETAQAISKKYHLYM